MAAVSESIATKRILFFIIVNFLINNLHSKILRMGVYATRG